MKSKLCLNVVIGLATSILMFLLIPFYMVGNSPEDYLFIDITVLAKSGAFFMLLFWGGLGLISLLFRFLSFNRASLFFSLFIFFWVFFAGLILSPSASVEMVDPEVIAVDTVKLFVVALLVLISCFLSMTKFRAYVLVFVSTVVFITTGSTVFSISTSDDIKIKDEWNSATTNESLSLSDKKNILVVSFDGMSGHVVESILKKHAGLSESLKDFTFFNNAVSQAAATGTSLMGDLYGIQDFKAKGESVASAKSALDSEGFRENLIAEHIVDTYQYGYTGFGIDQVSIPNKQVDISHKSDTFDFVRYPLVRVWTSFLFRVVDWGRYTRLLKGVILEDEAFELFDRLKEHKGKKWDIKNILSLLLFDSFTSGLRVEDKDISLRYIHMTFTHFPVDYDENCNYRSDDKVWFDSNQNERGVLGQDACGVKTFVGFLDKLIDLGVYDDSLIVFKSDHGKPSTYYSSKPHNLLINNNIDWGYSRYRPLLMIKDFNAHQSEINIESNLVLLNDIAKTICFASEVSVDCDEYAGINLLSDENSNEGGEFYVYLPKDKKSDVRYETHISVKIPSRKEPFLQALKKSSQVEISEPASP